MLEKPDLAEAKISACLQVAYGLHGVQLEFLPLGADVNTAAYRAETAAGMVYFAKMRRANFDATSLMLPTWLSEQGIAHLIVPLANRAGELWTALDEFTLMVYPFVEGRDGYERALAAAQWVEFGAALRRIHDAQAPGALLEQIQRENYTPYWRDSVRLYLRRFQEETFDDPVLQRLGAFLAEQRAEIIALVDRTDELAGILHDRSSPCVVCHTDLHAGNLLITADGAFYIVDWDNPLQAPKERDLMFVGGGQGFVGITAEEEVALFYRGYGQVDVDPTALAYYRYERIVQDVATFCEGILASSPDSADREQSLRYLMSSFRPGSVLDIAKRYDRLFNRQGHDA